MTNDKKNNFMKRAADLAIINVEKRTGGPFGCVIVKDGEIIAEGANSVTTHNDPTAHAEVVAIRRACEKLKSFQLTGCTIYTSCEPCPMCLGAIYWARPDMVYYAGTRFEAADAGFDDAFIYDEIAADIKTRKIPFLPLLPEEAIRIFNAWKADSKKIEY